ncbi:hypothetical protein M231_04863 [Tremella mesenterica]|uniref:Uncharacterized protein n=1 Tax=Tremella mesenterica TaxID=5217 RepID=A0A4Q1BJN3_TREME|nr:hypothetical protein M231_04863 [Tremella mesenterica]
MPKHPLGDTFFQPYISIRVRPTSTSSSSVPASITIHQDGVGSQRNPIALSDSEPQSDPEPSDVTNQTPLPHMGSWTSPIDLLSEEEPEQSIPITRTPSSIASQKVMHSTSNSSTPLARKRPLTDDVVNGRTASLNCTSTGRRKIQTINHIPTERLTKRNDECRQGSTSSNSTSSSRSICEISSPELNYPETYSPFYRRNVRDARLASKNLSQDNLRVSSDKRRRVTMRETTTTIREVQMDFETQVEGDEPDERSIRERKKIVNSDMRRKLEYKTSRYSPPTDDSDMDEFDKLEIGHKDFILTSPKTLKSLFPC